MVADGNKRWVFFTDREPFKSYKSLDYMMERLPSDRFIRSHNSYILHLNHARYFWYVGKSIEVLLYENQLGRVSHIYFWCFRQQIRNFPFLQEIDSEDDIPDV